MGLANRLRHDVIIQRRAAGTRNERGNPKAGAFATLRTVRGWYQPATKAERDEASSGGALAITGVVFMLPTDVTESDRLVIGGETFDIVDVHDAAGKDQHYEVTVHRGSAGA